jgi:selenocysteine-specific elongation factor
MALTAHQQQVLLDRWKRGGAIVRIGEVLVTKATLTAVEQQVVAITRLHHATHPLEDGIPREELRERLFSAAATGVFEHVIGELVSTNQIVARDRVALRGHRLALTDEEAAARDIMVQVLGDAGLSPPDGVELAARVGAGKDVIDRVASLLVRQKVLVRVGDLLFHHTVLQRLKRDVQSLKQHATDRIDVATFKDRYEVSRKYAIPLLEFLDRERITRRVGDVRQIL